MSIFGRIGHAILTPFVLLGRALFGSEGLKSLAHAIQELLKTELGQIAWTAVRSAEGLADKSLRRDQAFNQIADAAKAHGLTVKTSAINLAIEMLVQHLKSEGVKE